MNRKNKLNNPGYLKEKSLKKLHLYFPYETLCNVAFSLFTKAKWHFQGF